MARKKSTSLAAEGKLSLIVTLDGVFGFIGKPARVEEGMVVLENALTIGYNTDGTPRLGFNQIPLGMLNPGEITETCIPVKNVSYCVSFDGGGSHDLAGMYAKFFKDLEETKELPLQ